MKEESLISFILGVTAMVLLILGILVSKRNEQ
jgi:glucose uptake protein GlcU